MQSDYSQGYSEAEHYIDHYGLLGAQEFGTRLRDSDKAAGMPFNMYTVGWRTAVAVALERMFV